jgi:hypothetical protein
VADLEARQLAVVAAALALRADGLVEVADQAGQRVEPALRVAGRQRVSRAARGCSVRGSWLSSRFGPWRRPTHAVFRSIWRQLNAASSVSTSNHSSFLRPALAWETMNDPRAPLAKRTRMLPKSSVSIATGVPLASPPALSNEPATPSGRERVSCSVPRSASTSTIESPVTCWTRSAHHDERHEHAAEAI